MATSIIKRKPTIEAGDSITIHFDGATFLTTNKTTMIVTLPINAPINADSVTVSNIGAITRQAGKYTHGSSATQYVPWEFNTAQIEPYIGVTFSMVRTTTTDAVNNEAIGFVINATLTFS